MLEFSMHVTNRGMHGAALPVAMIFLFLITLTGVTMLETSVDNQKLTNNYQHHALSYQAADSVLYKLLTVDSDDVGPGYTNAFEATFPPDFNNVADQPDMNIDLTMTYVGVTSSVAVKGFEFGGKGEMLLYQAAATGTVGTASVTNKMGLALIKPSSE